MFWMISHPNNKVVARFFGRHGGVIHVIEEALDGNSKLYKAVWIPEFLSSFPLTHIAANSLDEAVSQLRERPFAGQEITRNEDLGEYELLMRLILDGRMSVRLHQTKGIEKKLKLRMCTSDRWSMTLPITFSAIGWERKQSKGVS